MFDQDAGEWVPFLELDRRAKKMRKKSSPSLVESMSSATNDVMKASTSSAPMTTGTDLEEE